jgi:hypothetical protein
MNMSRQRWHEVRLSVRLPHDVHERLVAKAQAEHRSVNAQIVFTLQRDLSEQPDRTVTMLSEIAELQRLDGA